MKTQGVRWLLLQAVLVHAAMTVVRPMVSYRALDLGADTLQIGFIATSAGLLPLLLAFAVGRRSDVWGAGRLLVAGGALSVSGSIAALLAPGLPVIYAASAALGLAHLLLLVGHQAAVSQGGTQTERDRGFGALTSANSVGQFLGPTVILTLAGRLAGGGSVAVVGLGMAAGLALVAAPLGVLCTLTRRPERPAGPRAGPRQAASRLGRTEGMWRALLVSGTTAAALDILPAFLPAWAEERGISVAVVGWLLGLRALVTVLVRLSVTWLIATLGRRATFLGALAAGIIGMALLPFVGAVGGGVAMVLLGMGFGLSQPLTLSWVATLAPPEMRGAAVGLRMSANRLAQTVVPATVTLAAAASGTGGVFVGSALLVAAAATTVLRPQSPGAEA